MLISLVAIFLVFVLFVFYISFFQSRFVARRNAIILMSADDIAQHLNDLNNWPSWIPWLLYEKTAKLDFHYTHLGANTELPSCLEWQGELINTGYISIVPARSGGHYCHTVIDAEAFFPGELHFNIDLGQQGAHTLVSIQVSGDVPFFKRWQTSQLLIRAARDIELALIRLTAHLANQTPSQIQTYDDPKFDLLGQYTLPHFDAVTRPFRVRNQPMSQKMEQGFHDLYTLIGPDNIPAGPSFAIYTKANPSQHHFVGKLGIPVQNLEPCDSRPERITLEGDYLVLHYFGNYQHLSLAWHVAHNFMRLRHQRVDRKRPGVEVFETGPCKTTSSKNYVTKICLAVK